MFSLQLRKTVKKKKIIIIASMNYVGVKILTTKRFGGKKNLEERGELTFFFPREIL